MTVQIGLIGAGTVGGGVIKVLQKQRSILEKAGVPVRLARVADK
jgi:homoserine dehydrogenase